MCVCASIKPGMPVYRERSIISAPLGIGALPLAMLCTWSSSTMTTALVKTRPVPSTNLPNLMALVAARAVEDVARNNRTTNTLALRMSPPEISEIRLYFSNNNWRIGAADLRKTLFCNDFSPFQEHPPDRVYAEAVFI